MMSVSNLNSNGIVFFPSTFLGLYVSLRFTYEERSR